MTKGSKIVSFRADVAVADAISKAAEERGLNSSDFIRTIMLKFLKPEKESADATAAKIKALSPEAQKKVVRGRAVIKELRVLRAPRPASNPLDDFFQDTDEEEVAGRIQALELELAELKKAVGKELSMSKGPGNGKGKKAEDEVSRVFSVIPIEGGQGDEDGEGGRGEKSDAEKNADGFLEIKGLVDKLGAFVEERGWLDRLFGSGDSVEDLLIKKFRALLDGAEADGEELGGLQEKALRVIAIREKRQKLEAGGANEDLIQGLEDELEPIREELLADSAEKKKAAVKDSPFLFWWD